ncbi:hypothetical protein HZB06_03135 [Candidatus Wolfebacteria bacterium]|nr:hypothetical protein [Candidatus Wolfebacteria bacterium]
MNYLSYKLPYYAETMTRLGMVNTHFPSYARIVLGSVMGLLVFCWILRKKILNPDSAVLFFIAGILTGIVAINQNVITGRNFEFLIHYEMAAVFFLMLAMAYLMKQFSLNPIKPAYGNKLAILAIFSVVVFSGLADYWVSASGAALFLILAAVYLFIPISPNSVKLARGIKLAAVAVFLFAVFSGLRFYWINISAVSASANTIYIQKYAPIFSWLKNNTVPDSVVYANERLSDFIPVYTADNVFYHRDANYFFISDREVLERFIINNFFEKFDDEFIVRNCYSIVGVRFAEAYRYAEQGRRFWRLLGLKPGSEIYLPDEEIIKIMDKARELQKKDFIQELKKYRVDYLIWDKIENPGWRIDLGYFKKVYEADSLVIFKPI